MYQPSREREISLASESFAEAAPSIVISSLSNCKTKGLVMSSKEAALNERLKSRLRKQINLHHTTPSQHTMRSQYIESCIQKHGTETGTGTSGFVHRNKAEGGHYGFTSTGDQFIGSHKLQSRSISGFGPTPLSTPHELSSHFSSHSRPVTNQTSHSSRRRGRPPNPHQTSNSPTERSTVQMRFSQSQLSPPPFDGTTNAPNVSNLSSSAPSLGNLDSTHRQSSKVHLGRSGQLSLGASPSTLHLQRIKDQKKSLPELQVLAQPSTLQRKKKKANNAPAIRAIFNETF